jgi:hypothetical protein
MVKLHHLGLIAIAISSILTLSVALPAAYALTQRDDFSDNHTTFRFLGGQKICGGHLCSSVDYSKHLKQMYDAQRSAAVCREALKQGKKC